MIDLEATAKQTVDEDSTIPDAHKQKALNYTLKAAKDGFKLAEMTNAKLVKLSELEEQLIVERPHHRRFHLFGFGKRNKCEKSRSFKWHRCRRHFGFRFCRRVFFRRECVLRAIC